MPSKMHWTLNPKKWFGTISSGHHKRTEKINHPLPKSTSPSRTTASSTLTMPRISMEKHKTQIVPVSVSTQLVNDKDIILASNGTPIRQFQLPAFSARRNRDTSQMLSSRPNVCVPKHTEPTIRKNRRRGAEELSIDIKRLTQQAASRTIYNLPPRSVDVPSSNMSRQCVVEFPNRGSNRIEELSSLSFTSSSSSSCNEDRDNSWTSGIYTDDRQPTDSKETMEIRSTTSIPDSQMSTSKVNFRPIVHHYRRPMSDFDTIDNETQQRQVSVQEKNRSCSAENILETDDSTPLDSKLRQSPDTIDEKLDKHVSIHRLSSMNLEKVGFIRVGADAYRLSVNKNEQLYHQRNRSSDFFSQYSDPNENDDENEDELLPAANDEECYATIPRTSSTEQLNTYMQEDLRLLVDQCLRPMINSIGKNRLTKTQQQLFKRTTTNNDPTPLKVEDITEKLLSSVDCSIYSQFERCC